MPWMSPGAGCGGTGWAAECQAPALGLFVWVLHGRLECAAQTVAEEPLKGAQALVKPKGSSDGDTGMLLQPSCQPGSALAAAAGNSAEILFFS